jgi:anti-sigma regulatory factor (Ser/Thr protein kinase)
MVAIHEALTNSVIHGNLGVSSALKEQDNEAFARAVASRCSDPAFANRVVDVRASFDNQEARWMFTDQGEGFDVEKTLARLDQEDPDPLRPSGRGLLMIRAYVDEMRFDDRGRQLTLTIRKGDPEEKRSQQRLPLSQSVHVTPIDARGQVNWQAGQDAVARNISSGGIALLQSGAMAGGRVLITLPKGLSGQQEPISIPAEIRHWHDMGDNVIEVGCRFESPLSSAEGSSAKASSEAIQAVARLVHRLGADHKPHEERRTSPRVPYTDAVVVARPGLAPQRGFARDLSRSGIAFFSTTELPMEVIALTLPIGEGESAISIRAQVVRCTRLIEGFYDVAARFLPG